MILKVNDKNPPKAVYEVLWGLLDSMIFCYYLGYTLKEEGGSLWSIFNKMLERNVRDGIVQVKNSAVRKEKVQLLGSCTRS